MTRKYTKRVWTPTNEAAQKLDRHPSWFRARIKSGTFRVGIHYRNTSDGVRPTYEFDLEAIDKLYE